VKEEIKDAKQESRPRDRYRCIEVADVESIYCPRCKGTKHVEVGIPVCHMGPDVWRCDDCGKEFWIEGNVLIDPEPDDGEKRRDK